jgi:hypothetical protein
VCDPIREPVNSHKTTRPRERFDQRVGAEADQRDRTGREAGADGNRRLQNVVADAAPRQQARLTL